MMNYNDYKLVFCDFDGVLTSKQTKTYFNPDPTKYKFAETLVDKLIWLCEKSGAKVLMTTNWRKFPIDGYWQKGDVKYNNPLQSILKRLGDFCIGTLPPERHITKSDLLEMWIEDNDYKNNFVIFDDDRSEGFEMSKHCNHFVLIDNEVGLSDCNIHDALTIFAKYRN